MRFGLRFGWIPAGALTLAVGGLAPNSTAGAVSKNSTVKPPAEFVKKYCFGCHGGASGPSGVGMLNILGNNAFAEHGETWQRISRAISNRHMPPAGSAQPSVKDRDSTVATIEQGLLSDPSPISPGRVTMRRLNREEYNNTIFDLTGLDLRLADDFPSDDVGDGFDNLGDVLSMSPLLMERYLQAAIKIAETAIQIPGGRTTTFDASRFMKPPATTMTDDGFVRVFVAATVSTETNVKSTGDYRLVLRAHGDQAGPEPCGVAFVVDGQIIDRVMVRAEASNPTDYEIPIHLAAGSHQIGVRFLNDYYDGSFPDPKRRDRNLIIHNMRLVGPLGISENPSEAERRIIYERPKPGNTRTLARAIIDRFASRAFRRPVSSEESDRLMRVFLAAESQREPFERGIQLAVAATLASPNFLFRAEPIAAASTRLSGELIASRLSYFLWNSMPDDELLGRSQTLTTPDAILTEANRMLRDPKSARMLRNFAGQWLQLRKLSIHQPSAVEFPKLTKPIQNAMATETERFFAYIAQSDQPITAFLDSDYTFVNEDLANYYGIEGVSGKEFRKIALSKGSRGGVWTQGSVLTVTSNPTRTSPVKRGKWILENLLGTPPPPPPPGVGALKEDRAAVAGATIKERMREHRSNPSCAGCHAQMDAIGFSLENFDGAGAWRTKDGNFPVESESELPDGTKINGADGLRHLLLSKKGQFTRTFCAKMLTYALGRSLTFKDKRTVEQIAQHVEKANYKFSAVIQAIVTCEPFLKQSSAPQVSDPK